MAYVDALPHVPSSLNQMQQLSHQLSPLYKAQLQQRRELSRLGDSNVKVSEFT